MRLDCPNCAASYDVPDTLLGGRRAVRCARCGHQWAYAAPAPLSVPFSVPAAAEAEPAPPEMTPVAAARPVPLAPRPPAAARPGLALRLAWAGSAVLLAAGLIAALALHRPIARAWPPSQRLYAALGLKG
ncbi:MAG: zinc-ribbon domain-containing protein [Acetobacteraceae bacterium]